MLVTTITEREEPPDCKADGKPTTSPSDLPEKHQNKFLLDDIASLCLSDICKNGADGIQRKISKAMQVQTDCLQKCSDQPDQCASMIPLPYFFDLKSTISIIRVTLNSEFNTLWLLPRILESAVSNLTNDTLVDMGGFNHQS